MKRTDSKPVVVTHLWWDYVPQTFIEPHSYLSMEAGFRSVNLVSHLWHNGKKPDRNTYFLYQGSSANLVNPSLLFRLLARISRSRQWRRFKKFSLARAKDCSTDVVHSHFGTTGCEFAEPLASAGLAHVVTLYGYDGSAALLQSKLQKKYRKMFSSAAKIIVLCEIVRDRLVALGCDPNKIKIWNMPAGVERYPYQPRPKSDTLKIIMAARFSEAKGHVYLIQAMRKLIDLGHSVQLTLMGYGNNQSKLRNEIRRLKLENHIVLLDNELAGNFYETYLEQLYRHDLFVLPAIRDRHGTDEAGPALTMVCAQASGLPVICTKFPGAEISVIEGESGLYCEEKNSDSIAEKILQLIRDPDLRARMGKRGSEIAMRDFSEWDQMEKLIEIYHEAAGRSAVHSKAGVETDGDNLHPLDRYRIPEIRVIPNSEVGEF